MNKINTMRHEFQNGGTYYLHENTWDEYPVRIS